MQRLEATEKLTFFIYEFQSIQKGNLPSLFLDGKLPFPFSSFILFH
jgi:hypothetical protein